jgi:hypothetical protein
LSIFSDPPCAHAAKKVGDSVELREDQKQDPLLDSLSVLEANNVLLRNAVIRTCKAFKGVHGHLFPKKKVPADLIKLVDVFNGAKDPAINFKQAATKTCAKITMSLVMSHGEEVYWDKVNASRALDDAGQPLVLVPFLKRAKRFSKKMIALMHSTSVPAASATPSVSANPSEVS